MTSTSSFGWGGEEFVIVAPELPNHANLAAFAEPVTASIGVALLPDSDTADLTLAGG